MIRSRKRCARSAADPGVFAYACSGSLTPPLRRFVQVGKRAGHDPPAQHWIGTPGAPLSVPIANENRLVLPDALGTTLSRSRCGTPVDFLTRRVQASLREAQGTHRAIAVPDLPGGDSPRRPPGR